MDFICEPLYEHLVHQEHLEYLRQLEAKETNNIDNNGPIWTSLDPMLEGGVRMSFRNKEIGSIFLGNIILHFSGCRKNRENWSALKVKKEEPRVES